MLKSKNWRKEKKTNGTIKNAFEVTKGIVRKMMADWEGNGVPMLRWPCSKSTYKWRTNELAPIHIQNVSTDAENWGRKCTHQVHLKRKFMTPINKHESNLNQFKGLDVRLYGLHPIWIF